MAYSRRFILALLVLVMGSATTAQAGPWMYSGRVIIEGFGNDTTTGTTYPFNSTLVGVYPLGYYCNSAWPNSTSPWGTYCGSATQDGGANALTGGGNNASVTGASPASFTIPAADTAAAYGSTASTGMVRVTNGSFPYYFPYLYGVTHVDLRNKAGNFFGGGGPGNFTFNYSVITPKTTTTGSTTYKVAQVVVKEGPNQFGGVMRLLGSLTDVEAYYRAGGVSIATFDWLFDDVGATAQKTGGGQVTGGFTRTHLAFGYHTLLQTTVQSLAVLTAFSWTTGTATATAFYRGPVASHMQRKGYDNRTALGKGAIQLVAPGMTHWLSSVNESETVQIGIMTLEFIPEPENWMMLFAGVSLLGILYRVHRR